MRFDKKLVLQVLPYVVSGAALLWCMKQCSSIDDVQAVNDAQSDAIVAIDSRTDSLLVITEENTQAIGRVAGMVGKVNDRVNAAMDSIDSINARVDSMRAVNKEIKARVDSLAQATKECQKKAKAKKKVAPKPVCAPKPQVVRPVVAVGSVPTVKVVNGGTGNTNVVNINNGGTVNNYYGTPAPKATPCVAEKAKQCNNDVVFTYRRVRTSAVVVEITR